MRVGEFSCELSAALFSGCTPDYLNHYDTVTLAAAMRTSQYAFTDR